MRILCFLICIVFLGCQPKNTITVDLSLDSIHESEAFISIKAINHTEYDLFVVRLSPSISIYEKGKDITENYWTDQFKDTCGGFIHFRDSVGPQNWIYEEQLNYQNQIAEVEWKIVRKLNSLDSIQNPEQWNQAKFLFDLIIPLKYGGLPIKAHDTIVIHERINAPIHRKKGKNRHYEIKYDQNQLSQFFSKDTIKIDSIIFYGPFLDTNIMGYKMYDGDIMPRNTLKIEF